MVMVSASTLDWGSARALLRHPKLSSAVMLATVVVTVATDNLAAGVGVGVLLSGVFFTFKVSRLLSVEKTQDGAGLTYRVSGQVFFASADLRSEEHTSELQSPCNLVCRLLLEK